MRHIRLFEAALAHGSLSRAAGAVHISQPAASQALAKLRQIYGADLMVRQGNGIVPTEQGMIVGRRCSRALDQLRGIAGLVAAGSRLSRGLAADRVEIHATIPQLRAIAAFAEAGSFAGAAQALGQTEAAVQRAARELERIGGAAFFAGVHRAVTLTSDGQAVAARASLALSELDRIGEELRELAGHYDGRLVIGTLPLVRTSVLPAAVVALMARHPQARVEIVDGAFEHLAHGLATGRLDMVVGALRAGGGAVEEPLFTDRLSVVARAGHPLVGTAPTPEILARYPWVVSRRGTPNRAVFDGLVGPVLQNAGRGFVETGSLVALRGILRRTDALALLSRLQIETEIEAGMLTVLGPPVPGSERVIGITTRPDWVPTALQRDFLSILRAAAPGTA